MNATSYKTAENCAEASKRGRAVGAVFDEMAFRRILAQGRFKDLGIDGETFGSHPHAFTLRKRSPYLSALNQDLRRFSS
jgi:hypothetical protein